MKRTPDKHLVIDPELHRAVKVAATERGLTLRELIADLLTAWLRRMRKAA